MEIKILDAAYIVEFNLNTEQIRNAIKIKIFENLDKEILDKLIDWKLYFYFRYNNVEEILIYLKGKSMPQTKEREITVHIPIPVKSQAAWGVVQEDHIYDDPKHLNDKIKNFERLEVDFSKFTNRDDYVEDCMWRVVKYCFKKGFKINGVELKMDI